MSKVYEIITNQIIEKLEEGTIPWERPWYGVGTPVNFFTGREYRGINTILLGMQMYDSPFWATFNQITHNYGRIKKGEKSTLVVFWKMIEYETSKTDKEGNPVKDERPFLRYYRVFNLDQTEDIPWQKAMDMYDNQDNDPIDECENVVDNYQDKPEIRHGGGRAYYSPIHDYVQVPNIETFKSSEGYYNTLFHELVHSTGHMSRCNRKNIDAQAVYGSENYSREELVAEIGSTFFYAGLLGLNVR